MRFRRWTAIVGFFAVLHTVACAKRTAASGDGRTSVSPDRPLADATPQPTVPSPTTSVLDGDPPAATPTPPPQRRSARSLSAAEVAKLSLPGIQGETLEATEWTDAERHVALVAREVVKQGNGVLLRGYTFRLPPKGPPVRVWQMNDGVAACEFDNMTEFAKPALTVTDVDADGVSEVTVAYRVDCVSDVSPLTHKVLVYEGPQKHALRGSILLAGGEALPGFQSTGGVLHQSTEDDALRQASNEIRKLASDRWRALLKR